MGVMAVLTKAGFVARRLLVCVFCVTSLGVSALASEPKSYVPTADPFSFCEKVGTADSPDGGFGPSPAPTALEAYFPSALGVAADAKIDMSSVYWRCMDGHVYICAVGANLVCDRKPDRSTANPGADNYCREHPHAASVPAYATGHSTLYVWRCRDGLALRDRLVGKLDRRGFRVDIWHQVHRAKAVTERP
jgi:hypothetical protein